MSCQDKVVQQWKWDSSHLPCAGRNDGGLVFSIKRSHRAFIFQFTKEMEVCRFFFYPGTCLLTALARLALSLWLQTSPESTFLFPPSPPEINHHVLLLLQSKHQVKNSLPSPIFIVHSVCHLQQCHNRITSHPFPTQYLGVSLLIPLS